MPKMNGRHIAKYGHQLYPTEDHTICFYCGESTNGRYDYIPMTEIAKNEELMVKWGRPEKWAVPSCKRCADIVAYKKLELRTPEERRMYIVGNGHNRQSKYLGDQLDALNQKPWFMSSGDGKWYEPDPLMLKGYDAKLYDQMEQYYRANPDKASDVIKSHFGLGEPKFDKPFDPLTDIAEF